MTKLGKKIIALFEEEWEADEDYAHFEVIEDGDWEVDCKYQFRSSIVKFMDKYYQITESRTGSYHTDYYYDDFLKMNLHRLFDGTPFVLTGNYPYNISSQIFFKMLLS